MAYPTFQLSNLPSSQDASLILHGGSNGIESAFIKKVFARSVSAGKITLAFNFPYKDRGEENSSGDELAEEIDALAQMVSLLKSLGFTRINLIAKSLGGIVASYYLQDQKRDSAVNFKLAILGYVVDDVKPPKDIEKFIVIQGSNDRFGNAEVVRAKLESLGIADFTIHEISGADHSYRDENRNPIYEDEALDKLFAEI